MNTDNLVPYTIRKRSKTRTVMVPSTSGSWTPAEKYPAKYFRFLPNTTEYRRGPLVIVFNLDGKAIEGWSYWTCMFCYSEPTEDFPNGRLIRNDVGYGVTTGKHTSHMWHFFGSNESVEVTHRAARRVRKLVRVERYPVYGTDEMRSYNVTRPTGIYYWDEETGDVDPVTHFAADQICWGRGVQPSEMREELKTMARHTKIGERSKRWRIEDAERAAVQAEREAAEREAARKIGLETGSIVDLAAMRKGVGS